ncbi:uncharacterized protein [Porites lutea]|uniref:uncharacterized protein n=1 Tax=Porites lutea TaxID=51062 RepID=UPI003CC6C219
MSEYDYYASLVSDSDSDDEIDYRYSDSDIDSDSDEIVIDSDIYADFECFTKPMNTCSPNPEYSYNYNYQKHEPSGFCFYIKGIVPDTMFEPILYTKTKSTDDIAVIFVSKLGKKELLTDNGVDKVRDHCHFTGQYRGAAHNSCNLQCRKPMILPQSSRFLQTSLANLVSNLQPDDFHNTKTIFKDSVELLTRKGVYPYDYVSSIEKLSEKQLPPKSEFYSKLNDENVSDDDYQHAINVWNTFKCKTIRDYHDLYQKSDVLLLSDVFENFRKTCLHHYNLDPAHYYTSPGLAWDACLKETGQELQLLHDYDMVMMFEKGTRGGISHISKRYAEANNKYMVDYNPDEPSTYIQYLDANNLYGWAMPQSLPTHGFKCMRDLTKDKLMDILEKANHSMLKHGRKGYIFEVDLEYPPDLWKSHNDYPLAPEKMIVNGVEKLICHLNQGKTMLYIIGI